MKRGAIALVQLEHSPASKARPCVIIQRQSALELARKVTVCPLTTHLRGTRGGRPFVAPSPENGLHAPSEVQVDWVFTHRVERIGKIIGQLDFDSLDAVDGALRQWLAL